MKLLTLNTHSLEEQEMELKQKQFAEAVCRLRPDIIALQEVNQRQDAMPVSDLPESYHPESGDVIIKADNHALAISRLLDQMAPGYTWTWLPIKVGYDKYDEGMAFFSKKPIQSTENILVSETDDFDDYHTRRILGIQTEDGNFYSIHLSWWQDADEPFAAQWKKLKQEIADPDGLRVLMGDFNSDAAVRGEGYDLVKNSGFFDTYALATDRDEGVTVPGAIDGWRDQDNVSDMRIDQIWISSPCQVRKSRVVFNGQKEPVISDHFGVLVEMDDPAGE